MSTAAEIIRGIEAATAALVGVTPSIMVHAPVSVVHEVAAAWGAQVDVSPFSADSWLAGRLLVATTRTYGQCTVSVLASEARPVAESAPTTCSECSGPLEDGMGCTPREGRCGSCVYEGAMRAAKAKQAREEDLSARERMRRHLAAEHQRQQGEGYGPGREQ